MLDRVSLRLGEETAWSSSLAGHEPTADKYFSVLHIFIST
jgi:hypothetical protein